MVDQHEHKTLSGPAVPEATRRLEEFANHARFPGTVITDQRRLNRLMKREDPAIYPGKYVTCVHKQETALCQQRRDGRGELRPDPASCKPLACRNVALTPDNLSSLREEIADIDNQIAARPLLPILVQHQLQRRCDEITAFLARHSQQEQS